MLPFPHTTYKNLLGPFGEFFAPKTAKQQFCQNVFYTILSIYAAVTSYKKSQKFNALICYKKLILSQLLSKNPSARFFPKNI